MDRVWPSSEHFQLGIGAEMGTLISRSRRSLIVAVALLFSVAVVAGIVDAYRNHVRVVAAIDALRAKGCKIAAPSLFGNSDPTILDAKKSQIDDDDLVNVRTLNYLRFVNLCDTKISDDGLRRLKGHPTIETLALNDTAITDFGLINLRTLPNLKGLALCNTRITDRGLPALAAIPKLQGISLNGTQITDDGCLMIAGFPSIRSLMLWDTNVSSQVVLKLKKSGIHVSRHRTGYELN
jgi:hypothetical protein